ncbi:MAG: hypothetical protein ACK47B_14430 [Armatimonadota bacterium]
MDWKTLAGVLIFVGFGICGQLILGRSMRGMPPMETISLPEIGRLLRYVLTTPGVILGTAILAIHFSALLGLLSRADVSVVVPAGAMNYLILTLLAKLWLREDVTPQRWLGVIMISIGVGVVLTSGGHRKNAPSPPETAESPAASSRAR